MTGNSITLVIRVLMPSLIRCIRSPQVIAPSESFGLQFRSVFRIRCTSTSQAKSGWLPCVRTASLFRAARALPKKPGAASRPPAGHDVVDETRRSTHGGLATGRGRAGPQVDEADGSKGLDYLRIIAAFSLTCCGRHGRHGRRSAPGPSSSQDWLSDVPSERKKAA